MMVMKKIAFLIISALTHSATATPVILPSLKIGNKEYLSASVEKDTEAIAKVVHETGVARVRILDLPKDVQERLGIDEAAGTSIQAKEGALVAAQRALAARAAAKARMLQNIAAEAKISVKHLSMAVIRVKEIQAEGVVAVAGVRMPDGDRKLICFQKYADGDGDIFVRTKLTPGKFVDGGTYPMIVIKDGTHTFTTVLGASRTIPKYKDVELALDEQFPDTVAK